MQPQGKTHATPFSDSHSPLSSYLTLPRPPTSTKLDTLQSITNTALNIVKDTVMPPKKATTPKKAVGAVKKAVSSATAKATAAHPPFAQMISEAITALKDRSGSSRQALKKYISENYKVNEALFTKAFNRYLAAGIDAGTFIVSRSFVCTSLHR